jgi:ABC-type nitrate/sulfonate/bicarbonate transport system, permease component
VAIVVAISIELIGGVPGLGADLSLYGQNGVYAGIYGIILVAGLLGVAINLVLERAERRLLSWHVAHRAVQS